MRRPAFWLDLAVKISLVLLLALGLSPASSGVPARLSVGGWLVTRLLAG
jgi:hypothetical protein